MNVCVANIHASKEKNMKPSKYNFFKKIPNLSSEEYVAYNSYSNALAILSAEEYIEYKKFEENNTVHLDEELLKNLFKGNFIVKDETDEIELIRERMMQARYNSTSLGLTIAPTLNCNFRCAYCYEKGCEKDEWMSDTIQENIVECVKSCAATINNLQITWYGGEPLLAINIIENLTRLFKKICQEFNIKYAASIVTNGYLLDFNMIQRLIACDVTYCQITIDGDREEHNMRRPHVSGVDTYDTIVQNVCEASRYFRVGIRVNIDKDNKDAIFNVKNSLTKVLTENVVIYPAPIRSNYDCYLEESCFKSIEFLEFEQDYYTSSDLKTIMTKYPRQQGNSCCADSLNAYVINSNGDLYKCWSDIGRKKFCIGNIREGIIDRTKAIRYSKYDPTRDPNCVACKFLPICMGGCPRDVIERPNDRCPYFDELHKQYMVKIAEIMTRDNSLN